MMEPRKSTWNELIDRKIHVIGLTREEAVDNYLQVLKKLYRLGFKFRGGSVSSALDLFTQDDHGIQLYTSADGIITYNILWSEGRDEFFITHPHTELCLEEFLGTKISSRQLTIFKIL